MEKNPEYVLREQSCIRILIFAWKICNGTRTKKKYSGQTGCNFAIIK